MFACLCVSVCVCVCVCLCLCLCLCVSVCLWKNNAQVLSMGVDMLVQVWDFETGEFERTLKGHTKAVNNLAFDKDGSMLGE